MHWEWETSYHLNFVETEMLDRFKKLMESY